MKMNDDFIDMLEVYYEQPWEAKLLDARPELDYQVGVTPAGVEFPRCKTDSSCQDLIEKVLIDYFRCL